MKKLKLYLRISLLFMSMNNSYAQIWTPLANYPDSAGWYGAVGFSLNGKGYFGATGQRNQLINTDFYEYDPSNNSWQSKASFPGDDRTIPAYFSIGNFGYLFVGDYLKTSVFSGYKYDPSSNSWTQISSYPGMNGRITNFTSTSTKGYVGGGMFNLGGFQSDWWEYDPTNDSWTAKASFPFGARAGSACFSIDNIVYVGLGRDAGNDYNDLWAYNPATDTWTQKASFPGQPRIHPIRFVVNGKAIVGGGYRMSNSNSTPDYYIYDPNSNSWSALPGFTGEERALSACITIDSVGYFGLGGIGTGLVNVKNDFWKYIDTTDYIDTTIISTFDLPLENDLSIKIYPNPTNNEFSVYSDKKSEKGVIVINDITGRVVLKKEINFSLNNKFELIGKSGIYFVEIRLNNGGKQIFKLIKT